MLAYQLIPLGEPLLPLLTLRKPLLYLVLLRSLSRLTFNIFKIFFAFENLFEAGAGLPGRWSQTGNWKVRRLHQWNTLFVLFLPAPSFPPLLVLNHCAFLPTTVLTPATVIFTSSTPELGIVTELPDIYQFRYFNCTGGQICSV